MCANQKEFRRVRLNLSTIDDAVLERAAAIKLGKETAALVTAVVGGVVTGAVAGAVAGGSGAGAATLIDQVYVDLCRLGMSVQLDGYKHLVFTHFCAEA